MIDTVIERDRKRDLVPMRCGLVPSWWETAAKEAPYTFIDTVQADSLKSV